MIILPAIDLCGGEAVRLRQGDYAQKTVYSRRPAALARAFENMGARYLHIVDLDGAKSGAAVNAAAIREIRAAVRIPLQVGGGIRGEGTAALYLNEIGVDRVILGTAALRDPALLGRLLDRYGAERIAAGVDVRGGKAAVSGWTEDSGRDYLDWIGELKARGVCYIVATDITKDGTMTSPNWEMYKKITGLRVMVSGGVGSEEDIVNAAPYYGVIVGKAYYEKKVDLKKLLKGQVS